MNMPTSNPRFLTEFISTGYNILSRKLTDFETQHPGDGLYLLRSNVVRHDLRLTVPEREGITACGYAFHNIVKGAAGLVPWYNWSRNMRSPTSFGEALAGAHKLVEQGRVTHPYQLDALREAARVLALA